MCQHFQIVGVFAFPSGNFGIVFVLDNTRVRCVVRECKNTSYRNDSNCSFHDFPANKELCGKWISQIIKYEEFCGWVSNVASRITSNTKICSEHFEKACFQKSGEKKRLLPMAVPKLFPKPVRKSVLLSGIKHIVLKVTQKNYFNNFFINN